MLEALKEAKKAALKNEVPVGAVVVYQGKVVGCGYNKPISSHNPCAHAEIIALQQAAKRLKNYRLTETDMYVTIEPCVMCAGAMVWARIKNLYIGAMDPKTGACGSVFNIADSKKLNHQIKIYQGILEIECREEIQRFFKEKRDL